MEISTGVTLPDATLLMKDADGIHSVSLADKTKGRKVIIFAVPGAFTPTCSSAHVPSFIRTKDAFAAKGVDEIICISVNDPHVMHAWGEATGATEAALTIPLTSGVSSSTTLSPPTTRLLPTTSVLAP